MFDADAGFIAYENLHVHTIACQDSKWFKLLPGLIIMMQYLVLLAAALILVQFAPIVAAQEIQFAAYKELARVVTDMKTGNTSASITLQSINADEIMLPANLADAIAESGVNSLFITSKTACIPGVGDESCLLINLKRDSSWPGINAIHEGAREIGESMINDANAAFGINATFHSIYIHSESDAIIGIADPGTVTVAYTMPIESSNSMYKKIAPIFAEKIRDSGGFYAVASKIAEYPDSSASFAAVKIGDVTLMQSIVERTFVEKPTDTLYPIAMIGIKELEMSKYFDDGFYPLNSVLQIIILGSPQDSVHARPDLLQVKIQDDVTVPVSLDIAGWVVEQRFNVTDARYLFGTDKVAHSKDVSISFGPQSEIADDSFVVETDMYWPWALFAIIPIIVVITLAYVLKKRI